MVNIEKKNKKNKKVLVQMFNQHENSSGKAPVL